MARGFCQLPVLFVGLAVSAILSPSPAAAQPTAKPRIAVMNFDNSTWRFWGDNLGAAAADELTTQLFQTDRFSVVERAQLDAILDEQDLGASGSVSTSTAAEIGKLLGAQLILTGSITQFSIETKSGGFRRLGVSFSEAESKLDIRIVNTTTGEIMFAEEGEGNKRFGGGFFSGVNFERDFDAGVAQESLRPAVEDVVAKIADDSARFDVLAPVIPTGVVVGAGDSGIFINRGENFNLQPGQRFDVYRVIDEIKDADGTVLDRITDHVGVLEVTRVLSQSAICRVVEGEASEGDTIEGQ